MKYEPLSPLSSFSLPPGALLSPETIQDSIRQAKAVLAERELDRVRQDADEIRARCQSFKEFVKEAWKVIEPATPLKWAWHMDAICMHLEAITLDKLTPRLICNVPPGSSKSMLIAVLWQAWVWGPCAMPGKKFLSTSYETGNVNRDTRKTRDLVLSEWYQALWPLPLKRTGEASFENYHFGTREGVAFVAITGKRGDFVVIDDPHSLDGAESEADRTKAVRRFIEGGQNRLNDQETSAIVIVMQRLHEGDLTGAILARELGYEHIMIPMEFEPERKCITPIWQDPRTYDSELMDPVRMPPRAVDLLKKDNDYMWAGQYQQRPAPREGGMIKVDNILLVDSVPGNAVHVRGWDIAGSTRKTSPYTVGARLAYHDSVVFIVDVQRQRAEIDVAERLIVTTAHSDGIKIKQSIPQDPGQAAKSQKLHLSNRLAGLDFKFSPETGAKEDRAIPFASMVNSGSVRMVKAPWNEALINEMRNFPGSLYKDQVDAISRAFHELIPHMRDDDSLGVGAPIYPGND